MRVDLGVLDPDYVNVLPNGHEPFLGFALVQLARKKEWQDRARPQAPRIARRGQHRDRAGDDPGAGTMDERSTGTPATGSCRRPSWPPVRWTFVADMNCSCPRTPSMPKGTVQDRAGVPLVAIEGVTERINYRAELAERQAAQLLEMALVNFKERHGKVEAVRGLPMNEAVVGFSPESILAALGGTLTPLLDAIKSGAIRGVVGLVSCTTLRDHGQDVHTVRVAEELIKRDILVLSLGCGNAALQVAGLCSSDAVSKAGPGLQAVCKALGTPPVLSFGTCTDTGRLADLIFAVSEALGGVPIPDLPMAACAPEYMEQKATIDAIFALAYGLYTYVNPVPPVTGAPNLVETL